MMFAAKATINSAAKVESKWTMTNLALAKWLAGIVGRPTRSHFRERTGERFVTASSTSATSAQSGGNPASPKI
ncbi:MAG: hypothetical protein ABI400_14595 [Lacisediminihabitans sp.]